MANTIQRAHSYLVHEQLAAGGMGEVYLGTMVSPAGRRPVAIKRVAAERLRDGRAMTRLVAEARLGYQLTHANVCQVLDLVFDAGHAYLVMEYVRGADLRALVARRAEAGARLDVASALYVAREVARALDYSHRFSGGGGAPLHIVHGDVTPQNILLSLEGEVKLADFGIARALGTAAPGTDVVGGTRGFVAPEIVAGDPDHRSDVYSLGATLCFALTGAPPATLGSAAAVRTRADVPGDVVALIERAIARDAADRYLSAAELEGALAYELARRYPGYTPSALAALVRSSAGGREPAAVSDVSLFSIATQSATLVLGATTEVLPPWHQPEPAPAPPPEPSPEPARRATKTVTGSRAPAPPSRRGVAVWLGASAAVALGGGAAWWALRAGGAPAALAPAPVAVAPVPDAGAAADDEAGDEADDELSPEPRARLRSSSRKRKPRRPGARPDPAPAPEPAFLSVNARPWGAVFVDGERIADETPVYRWELPPGRYNVRVVFGDTGEHQTKTVTLRAGQHESLGFAR